jgi:signal transduction histidine kinase
MVCSMSSTGNGRLRAAPAVLTGGAAVLATLATVAVVGVPFVRFAYRAPALHVALETANALVALLVGYLVYGRFRQNRRTQELLVVLALCTVAVANLVLTAVPIAVTIGRGEDVSRWAAVAIRLLGTVLLTGAALVPPRRTIEGPRARRLVLLLGAAVGAVGVVGLGWGDELPPTVDPAALLDDATHPLLVAHPAVMVAQAVGMALYGVAAVAFTRQASRRTDELFRWFGAACVLAAFARLHYLLFPSLYSDYVYTGDLLRLGFYLLLLAGAGREIESYWQLRARTAVLEDRRRMARDLHDGLAQELAYLWSQSRALPDQPDAATVERIGGAAARALDEARRAIAALTRPLDEPFPRVLQQVADDLGSRYDVKVVTDLDPDVDLSQPHGEALLRITTEAVRNAVRHGGATRIELLLTARPLCLAITDDGRGFTPGAARTGHGGGFGMTSMRERAQAMGAELTITSAPGEGTTVRVTRP